MDTGFDLVPRGFKLVSVERAIVTLTQHRVQVAEIDPENPRALRLYLSNHQTLQITPHAGRLRFALATNQGRDTLVGQANG